MLSVECEYKGMTRFAETVRIETALEEYTGVRFVISYKMYGADGTLRAQGKTSHCFLMNGVPVSVKRKFPAWDQAFRAMLR